MNDGLLGPAQIRALAEHLGLHPSKQRGQNFVIDPNTIRRIARLADLAPDDVVIEVGPGLGSLTLALLPACAHTVAVEIDPLLAGQLPLTLADRRPDLVDRLTVVEADACRVRDLPHAPTRLVANLPYNVAVPVMLHLLATVPTLRGGVVMVQSEVADRLVAGPGSKVYGVPSAKVAWFARAARVGTVPPAVFWPAPRVDSGLVALECRPAPSTTASREQVFAVIDAAFAQRRKGLRAALAGWAGSASAAERVLTLAGIDPLVRGEQLTIVEFARIAAARQVT